MFVVIKSKMEVKKSFLNKIGEMSPEFKRRYLLWLLTQFKVDFSITPRVRDGGLYKYGDVDDCDKNSIRRTKTKNEISVWKVVGNERDFFSVLNDPKMPWIPRRKPGVMDSGINATFQRNIEKYVNKTITNKFKTKFGPGDIEYGYLSVLFKKMFREFRRGIFISIRRSKITHWIPYYKNSFTNSRLEKISGVSRDSLIDGCNIIENFNYTERDYAQYYDMFTKVCRTGNMSDSDFFINLGLYPKAEKGFADKYGIMVLSPVSSPDRSDEVIPTPDEWEAVTGEHYALSCFPFKSDKLETRWSSKKSLAVYRGGVVGCDTEWYDTLSKKYRSLPLRENSRVSLVKFLGSHSGMGIDAALHGDIIPSLKIKESNESGSEVYIFPNKPHPKIVKNLTEVEYDPEYIDNMELILKRSGSEKEQREVMDIVAYSSSVFKWWPAIGPVPGGGEGGGGVLSGSPAYKKAMDIYWNLVEHKVLLEKLRKSPKKKSPPAKKRSPMIDSPNPKSPAYVPGVTYFGGGNRGDLEKSIEKLERELKEQVIKASKEKYYIHGKGGVKEPRSRARPPGGLIGRESLSGMRKFWKKYNLGGKEERNKIINEAKMKGVMSNPKKTYEEQSKYKFVIAYNDVPGLMEFHRKALMGSVLFVFSDRRYNSWLLNEMKAGVHYVPVNKSNFVKIYRWYLWNSDKPKVREIAANLKKFMKKHFTSAAMIEQVLMVGDLSSYLNAGGN
tara:strand:+ start:12223 stop:14403 length:2181 start_codon:yes stop_codon:yes gene_type:complete